MKIKSLVSVLLTSSALLLGPSAQADTTWQWAPYGDAGLTLARSKAGWQVVESGKALPLSRSARIDHLTVAADAWWASAVERVDSGERLVLLKGGDESIEALPSPTVVQSGVLLQPTMLVGSAGLEGIIWIEGDSHQTTRVRASRWSGGGWSQPATVSPKRRGTQIALQAIQLQDGSYLASWSAYDGEDDEIVWSRFDGKDWSTPAPISANSVPDVTPVLRAVDGGALLAWSAYDGNDYRLYTATLRDGEWKLGGKMGGKGSIFPRFADVEGNLLIFQQTLPQGWVFAELSDDGDVLRSTRVDFRRPGPMAKGKTQSGVEVLWLAKSLAKNGDEALATRAVSLPWQTSVD